MVATGAGAVVAPGPMNVSTRQGTGRNMTDDIDGFSGWARIQGIKRHELLSRDATASPAHQSRLFQVLYDSTVSVVFAELRSVFEVAVKEYNDGCGFPDLRIGYADLKPRVIQVERRHAPRFILIIDADKPRGTALCAKCSTPDADLYRTPPPEEILIPLAVDPAFTRVVLERSAYAEVQRVLRPVLAV